MSISMISRKRALSELFLSHRIKVISGFSLGVGASMLFFSLLFLSSSLKVPKVQVFLQEFHNVGANSSVPPRPFSSKTDPSSSSSASNGSATSESHRSVSSLQNESGIRANGGEQSFPKKTHEKNGALVPVKGNFLDTNGQGKVSGKEGVGFNSYGIVKDVGLLGEETRIAANTMETRKIIEGESLKNSSVSPKVGAENNNAGKLSYVGKPGIEGKYEGDLIEKKIVTVIHHDSRKKKMKVGFHENCDIFDGKWIKDNSKPYYPLGSCPLIDRGFDCHINGRPDSEYLKWKWQPNGCDIPSLNATDFLERLRGQRLVFVGDSLNRNMWESMVCILRQSISDKKRVYEISGKSEFKKNGVYSFRFEEYNCSVDFVTSLFIVRKSTFEGETRSFETLRLDLMDRAATKYHDADIIVFNTGHWWTHGKTFNGVNFYQEGNHVYPKLKTLDAYTKALTTWARWSDRHIDANRTQVFFRGYSLTHYRGGQWKTGGQCHKETEPIFNEAYLEKYPSKMRVVEHVIQKMKTPVIYMNISRLTDYRKDGHPSIYAKEYKRAAKRKATVLYQDCGHWCLPGVPDTWNELLYASLLKNGKGTWKC